jgi:DNA-binding transcriptional LysR family regulator
VKPDVDKLIELRLAERFGDGVRLTRLGRAYLEALRAVRDREDVEWPDP